MRIDVITIFPELFDAFLTHGMVERARARGRLDVRVTDLRAFTDDRHRSVDDRPYGGGPGMVFKPEPVFRAMDLLGFPEAEGPKGRDPSDPKPNDSTPPDVAPNGARPILLCPQGRRLNQEGFRELAECPQLVLLCGRYEGFDERIVRGYPWDRLSIGDYVLSGGEVPAMVLIEGVARLLPGVLGHEESSERESFSPWAGPGGVDHPHYTRPPRYRGREVPPVLLSGNHGEIEAWRRRESRSSTHRMFGNECRVTGAAPRRER